MLFAKTDCRLDLADVIPVTRVAVCVGVPFKLKEALVGDKETASVKDYMVGAITNVANNASAVHHLHQNRPNFSGPPHPHQSSQWPGAQLNWSGHRQLAPMYGSMQNIQELIYDTQEPIFGTHGSVRSFYQTPKPRRGHRYAKSEVGSGSRDPIGFEDVAMANNQAIDNPRIAALNLLYPGSVQNQAINGTQYSNQESDNRIQSHAAHPIDLGYQYPMNSGTSTNNLNYFQSSEQQIPAENTIQPAAQWNDNLDPMLQMNAQYPQIQNDRVSLISAQIEAQKLQAKKLRKATKASRKTQSLYDAPQSVPVRYNDAENGNVTAPKQSNTFSSMQERAPASIQSAPRKRTQQDNMSELNPLYLQLQAEEERLERLKPRPPNAGERLMAKELKREARQRRKSSSRQGSIAPSYYDLEDDNASVVMPNHALPSRQRQSIARMKAASRRQPKLKQTSQFDGQHSTIQEEAETPTFREMGFQANTVVQEPHATEPEVYSGTYHNADIAQRAYNTPSRREQQTAPRTPTRSPCKRRNVSLKKSNKQIIKRYNKRYAEAERLEPWQMVLSPADQKAIVISKQEIAEQRLFADLLALEKKSAMDKPGYGVAFDSTAPDKIQNPSWSMREQQPVAHSHHQEALGQPFRRNYRGYRDDTQSIYGYSHVPDQNRQTDLAGCTNSGSHYRKKSDGAVTSRLRKQMMAQEAELLPPGIRSKSDGVLQQQIFPTLEQLNLNMDDLGDIQDHQNYYYPE